MSLRKFELFDQTEVLRTSRFQMFRCIQMLIHSHLNYMEGLL